MFYKKIYSNVALFCAITCLPFISMAQEDVYTKPLIEVLKEIEKRYQVTFNYDYRVNDLKVKYADWRYKKDVASTIESVLRPLDLLYRETSKGNYQITPFEYYRFTEEEGKEHLDQLLKLYANADQFGERKKVLKDCILKALGINNFQKTSDLNPIYTSKIKMNGYTVENVAIESMPGVLVFGTLYTPTEAKAPYPIIVSPHGHFYNEDTPSIAADSGRYTSDMQHRCATLAKMGAVVFNYDMYAWGESSLQTGGFANHDTGFALAMQTWNSKRVLDFLMTLKNVDKNKVGVTGASGGGTQTLLLAALDNRVTVSVPVVMVSSSFYGGCACESGLPIHDVCNGSKTNNAEIAALIAPRPLLVISDGADWTKSVPNTDYPYLRKIYSFYTSEANVESVYLPNDQHDYNFSKREPMYRFFAKHLGLNLKSVLDKNGKIVENGITVQKNKEMRVFSDGKIPSTALKSHNDIVSAFKRYHSNY